MERLAQCGSSFMAWARRKEDLPVLQGAVWGTSHILSAREKLYGACGRVPKVEDSGDSKEPETELVPSTGHYIDPEEDGEDEEEGGDEEGGGGDERKEYDTYISVIYIGISIVSLYCLAALDYTSETDLGNAVIFPDGYRFGNSFPFLPFVNVTHPGRCSPCYGDCDIPASDISGTNYLLSAKVCRGAIHSGVMDPLGGCFGFEFIDNAGTGELRFSKLSCHTLFPVIEALSILFVLFFLLFIPASEFKRFIYVVFVGWFFLVLQFFELPRQFERAGDIGNGFFEQVVNQKSQTLFLTTAGSYAVWKKAGEKTFPSPSKFPLDCFIFYVVPYWCGVRMDAFDNLIDIGISLSASVLSNPNKATWFFLFLAGCVLSLGAQLILYYKADILLKAIRYCVTAALIIVILSVIFAESLDFHFHHFAVGLVGAFLFQGQPFLRWSIALQAFSLGMFVNGVVIWEAAPFFDPEERDYISFEEYVNQGYKP